LRNQKPHYPSLSRNHRDPSECRSQTWQAKSQGIGLHFSENCTILASAILSQYTRVTDERQTDDRRHFMAMGELAMQLQRSAN